MFWKCRCLDGGAGWVLEGWDLGRGRGHPEEKERQEGDYVCLELWDCFR